MEASDKEETLVIVAKYWLEDHLHSDTGSAKPKRLLDQNLMILFYVRIKKDSTVEKYAFP